MHKHPALSFETTEPNKLNMTENKLLFIEGHQLPLMPEARNRTEAVNHPECRYRRAL